MTSTGARPQQEPYIVPCAVIFLIAFAIRLAYAYARPIPVSADAAYYLMVAENLHHGRGFVADYVWHYLAGIPDGLPVPSNSYWMPGTSLVTAGAFAIARDTSLRVAQYPSLIFGALLCAIAAWIAGALTRRREAALLAGAAAAVSYYLVQLSLFPDHFMLNAVLVNLSLLALWAAWRERASLALLAGSLAALAYLTRTDGAILAFVALCLAIASRRRVRKSRPIEIVVYFLIAFSLVSLPWWTRQTLVFGHPSGAGALRTAFLTNYDDLFRVDHSHLTLHDYLQTSQVVATGMKAYAFYRSLRILARALMLFSALAVAALWLRDLRREAVPWLAYLPLALILSCFLVPYPTLKGTGWHLLPALMPGLLALGSGAAVALYDLARLRAHVALGWVVIAAVLVSPCYWWAFPPPEAERAAQPLYPLVAAKAVDALGPDPGPVLTDSAWGLYHIARIPCAQFPTDGAHAALAVADAIGAHYVITRADATNTAPALPAMKEISDHRRFEPLARHSDGTASILVYRILRP